MLFQIIALIILLLLSGFFSSSELAFVVANKIKLELRARKNNLAAKNAVYFMKNTQIFFATILISNNVINIAFASFIMVFLFDFYQLNDYIILLISSTLLLLFGEIIPKYFAREHADRFILFSVLPLRLVTLLIYPIVKLAASLSSLLVKSEEIRDENISHLFDKDDMQSLIQESSEAGRVGVIESDIINKIFDLGEQKVYEAMTPRTDIMGVEVNSSIEDVIKVFVESGYSKLPIYEENLDSIKGVVNAYDMFCSPKDLQSIIKDISFVPETKKSLEMLNEFLDKHVSIAIVVDEFGGTAGLITVEDILEEMLGEIRDEYDDEEDVCKQIDSKTYVISGKVENDNINEQFELNIPEGDYETIGGYITSYLGRIPEKGETVLMDRFKIQILYADKTKIHLVKVFITSDYLDNSST